MKIRSLFAAIAGLTAGLALVPTAQATEAVAPTAPTLVSQASTETTCMPLQEVTTGETEIRKRIENRPFGTGNWNVDFLVPQTTDFRYFVAVVMTENTGPYWMDVHLRLPQGGSEKAFSDRTEAVAGTIYSIPFQSPTGRQSAVVNALVGGVNGNFYTISMAGCR